MFSLPFVSTAINRVKNQWASNYNAASARNDTFARAGAGDVQSVLASNRMINNFNAVNERRMGALERYNAAQPGAAMTGRLLGGDKGQVFQGIGGAIAGLNAVDPDMAFMANALATNIGATMGSLLGFSEENQRLRIQRTMDNAVQERFMKDTVRQGNYALEDINRQSSVLQGRLTDEAIANQDKYYGIDSFIQDSGIEGSANMGRNLAYMKGRDQARTALEYDLLGAQADNVARGMAGSFDQLVQSQEQATLQTLMAPAQFDLGGARQSSLEWGMGAPTPNDYINAVYSAMPPSYRGGAFNAAMGQSVGRGDRDVTTGGWPPSEIKSHSKKV